MKIALRISSPVERAIPNLIANVSSFKCKVHVDLSKGTIVASGVDPLQLENVIEVVECCFEITGVDIDTTDVVFKAEDMVVNCEAKVDSISEAVENVSESTTITESRKAELLSNTATKDFSHFENIEDALSELIGEKVQTLDKSFDLEPQLDDFLTAIGMSKESMIKQAFVVACKVKKVKYESILIELVSQYPDKKEDEIKQALKDAFKTWISNNYPTITKQFPKISIMSLLKFFVKNYK